MGKYIRLGLGLLAGAVVGVAVYEIISSRRDRKRLVMPDVKKSNVVRFPASRPPYAEGHEAALD